MFFSSVMCGSAVLVALLAIAGSSSALPKFETTDGKSPATGKGGDEAQIDSKIDASDISGQERPARFGFPTYSTDVQGFSQTGSVVPGVYGPVKLDIGGLLLGTIVGLGAFFILPKLLHVASPYGPYKRSEDEQSAEGSSLSHALEMVQESLNKYNVDSAACIQRAICHSVQVAGERTDNGTANSMENLVEKVAKNDITKSLIEGTEWQKAVDVAESGGNCSLAFPKCPYSLEGVASAIAKYLIT